MHTEFQPEDSSLGYGRTTSQYLNAHGVDNKVCKEAFFNSLCGGFDVSIGSGHNQIALSIDSATKMKGTNGYIEFTATATYCKNNDKGVKVKGFISFNVNINDVVKKNKFLIIDDDDSVHQEIKFSLKGMFPQCEIDEAYNIREATEYLSDNQYDLITLDGKLKEGKHGREVLSLMNSEQTDKVVIYSGEIYFLRECQNKGIVTYLKTSDFNDILPAIASKKKLA